MLPCAPSNNDSKRNAAMCRPRARGHRIQDSAYRRSRCPKTEYRDLKHEEFNPVSHGQVSPSKHQDRSDVKINHADLGVTSQNHIADSLARGAPSQKRTVVLSLDYDNCMDVLFDGAALRLHRRKMKNELHVMTNVRNILHRDLQRITADASRVILMVGSNRQSIHLDRWNRERLKNEVGQVASEVGWARHDFQRLAEEKGWELNRALLADKENHVAPGTAWTEDHLKIRFERGMDKEIKKNLIQYQFEQLHNLEGDIDFYFFDDHSDYLDFVRQQVVVPPSTNFFTVHFDWFSHVIEKHPVDLHAVDVKGQSQPLNKHVERVSSEVPPL